MPDRATAAGQIWPHLPSDKPAEPQLVRREPTSPLAQSMYPSLMPKPPPPGPRPRLTREEIFRDFSRNMDPDYARMVGFRKVGTR
jgi:hypothetical protein